MRKIGEPLSIDAAEKAFSKTIKAMNKKKPEVMTWAIIDKEKNEGIGLQALNWSTPPSHETNLPKAEYAEIGFMLLRKNHGKTIPKEAAGALIDYAFNHLKLQRVNTQYNRSNFAVAKLAQSLGFIYNQIKQPLDENLRLQYIEKQNWRGTCDIHL